MTQDRKLWRNARLATCDESMRVIENGAVVTAGGRIEWVGPESELPAFRAGGAAQTNAAGSAPRAGGEAPYEEHDLGGAWVTPGLIDCHTHLVFAGTRAGEYAQRLRGRSYAEIAREGGGILSTMRAVRAASLQQLIDESAPRLEALLAEGVTTIEIKSGYGLTLADEAKMLRAARALAQAYPVTVKTTFLAAHTVPPEFTGRADEYIDTIIADWLPTLHNEGLIDAVDIFCESIAFNVAQSERLFDAAHDRGLPVKMHAEQLTNLGGTQMASRHHALSCDHLEYATEADAAALASSRTVAVLLPVAFYCLADERKPPIQAFRSAGTHMALATDCNPGSAPATSLLLTMSMGTRLFGLTPEEALAGVTRNAARALGLQADRGMLARGQAADFVAWSVQAIEELSYWIGFNPRRTVVRAGRII
ncbi:MAG TPA: imidazolonepropionase [Steroidobacteraceae bacterium]|nr:imidazolonepropionase [Steroidobacteraceae bacterium]